MDDLYVEAIKKLAVELSFAVSCPRYRKNDYDPDMECPAERFCIGRHPVRQVDDCETCDEIILLWATKGEGV